MSLNLSKTLPKKPDRTKFYLTLFIVFSLIFGSWIFVDIFDPAIIEHIFNPERYHILYKMFITTNWSYFDNILGSLLETIKMAITGTFIGAIFAFPGAVLAANNFLQIGWLNKMSRIGLNIIRTIPTLVLASLLVIVFSIGAFSGIMALAVFTFGLISKMTYESIESIDNGQIEALVSVGASKWEILRFAIVPQILPQFMSYTLYAFEVNVRAAAVLGYVGAGGIGQKFYLSLAFFKYDNIGLIFYVFFGTVLIIDTISSRIRRSLV